MIYKVEKSLSDFGFWGGGKDRAENLTSEELDEIEKYLPELIGNEPTEDDINNLFWFDFTLVCRTIGLDVDEADNPVRDL